jgi:hypothetical protein
MTARAAKIIPVAARLSSLIKAAIRSNRDKNATLIKSDSRVEADTFNSAGHLGRCSR